MPTFDDILPRLVASYECGRLVPFIGSGMSIPACVDWKTLVENLEGTAAADGERERPRADSSADLVRRANAAVRKLQAREPGAFLAAVELAAVGGGGPGPQIPPPDKSAGRALVAACAHD
jgi:hypothetical protein